MQSFNLNKNYLLSEFLKWLLFEEVFCFIVPPTARVKRIETFCVWYGITYYRLKVDQQNLLNPAVY